MLLLTNGQEINDPTALLLGYKKRGFGQGKYGGFGGKIKSGETIVSAALRELFEECGLEVATSDTAYSAQLHFTFPFKPDWDQTVHVFTARCWSGSLTESEEMRPQWFKITDIPYTKMWQDARYWLPALLAEQSHPGIGLKILRARFSFAADNETIAAWNMERADSTPD